jgi:hypothetical protein
MFVTAVAMTSYGYQLSVQAMGSQKVPGIVVLHCNCRTHCNAYLNTFKVGPLRTHTQTHLLHRPCHCWKHRRKASCGILWSSAVAFDLMSSMVAKRDPLRPILRVGTDKSRSG